jgi:MFS family permease
MNLKTFASLKIRNYRLYFIGQAISLSGTWMQTIGQTWLVLQITKSGTALGLAAALQFLPVLFLGPWGGLIADRFSKRKILYFTQTAAGILALILGLLVIFGHVQVWMVYILAFALGMVSVVDNPARQTFVHEMVDEKHLPNAIALNTIEINIARVVGPALAGILIVSAGIGTCFIINAISYIAVIVALYMMREKDLHVSALVEKAKGQLKEGFKYVMSSPVIRDTLIMMAIIGTLTYEFTVSLPLLAQFAFHGNAGTYATLTSAMGVGSIIGGFIIASRRKTTPRTLVFVAFLFGLFVLGASFAPTLALAIALLVAVGFFSVYFTSLGNITLQLESAPEMRGRVMALWSVAFLGSTPIGGPIVGWVGEYAGSRWALALGGFAAVFAAFVGARNLRKQRQANLEIQESHMGIAEESVEAEQGYSKK